MSALKVLLALAAVGAVSAQSGGICSEPTITVAAPAEATIRCTTVEGSIVIEDTDAIDGDVIISGPRSIKGDLIVNGTKITSLSSSSVGNIGGTFKLSQMEFCSRLDFSALQTVRSIDWVALTALETLNFGVTGVTRVESVKISDTFLRSLDGLNMASVGTFDINNNPRLTSWETDLTNITESIIISDNNADLEVSFPSLTWANDMNVRGLRSLSVPVLQKVNETMSFDDNAQMESFQAPNLTETGQTLSVINNNKLTNLSFPVLTKTGHSLTIQNNQALVEIDGFPELKQVGGAITIRGNFTSVSLPKLDDVKGAFDVTSTENIESSCDTFQKLGPKQGGQIQGTFKCTSNDANANTGGDALDDDEDAGAFLAIDKTLVLGAAFAGVLAQLL